MSDYEFEPSQKRSRRLQKPLIAVGNNQFVSNRKPNRIVRLTSFAIVFFDRLAVF